MLKYMFPTAAAAALIVAASVTPLWAQTSARQAQSNAAGVGAPADQVPAPKGPDGPNLPTPQPLPAPGSTVPGSSVPGRGGNDNGGGNGNGPDGGGGSTAGLPDAVTVLNILWHLPHRPIGPSGSSDTPAYGPLSDGPKPKGRATALPPAPPPPPVLTAAAGVPFVPKPLARPAGTPPATAGALLPEVRDRELIVTLAAGSNDRTVAEISRDFGLAGDTLYVSPLLDTRVVRLRIPDARSAADVLQQLQGDVRIDLVQPNYVFTASGAAAAPLPVPQYATSKLHIDEAHKLARGKRVTIAVIDTGVDTAHPVFAGAVRESFNALSSSASTGEAHGTAIAGIVGARNGFTGIAPDADLLSARAFTTEKSGPAQSDTLALLKSLDWSVGRGARVINMSFAGPEDLLLGRAIEAAVKLGVVVIAAAGNGGPDAKPAYPAAFESVIAVSATDDADKPYANANRGAYIAVSAPGVDVVAPAPKGAYDISSGTSLAAAHVSGIAALMLEREPRLRPSDIRARLLGSAHNPGKVEADIVGAGIVDAAAALSAH